MYARYVDLARHNPVFDTVPLSKQQHSVFMVGLFSQH